MKTSSSVRKIRPRMTSFRFREENKASALLDEALSEISPSLNPDAYELAAGASRPKWWMNRCEDPTGKIYVSPEDIVKMSYGRQLESRSPERDSMAIKAFGKGIGGLIVRRMAETAFESDALRPERTKVGIASAAVGFLGLIAAAICTEKIGMEHTPSIITSVVTMNLSASVARWPLRRLSINRIAGRVNDYTKKDLGYIAVPVFETVNSDGQGAGPARRYTLDPE